MEVFLTSYATPNFQKVQSELNASARKWGINNILAYGEDDLKKSSYYQQNRSILDEVCGAGYWAWKPFFILDALKKLADGDILFYCDSGTILVDSIAPLVTLCKNSESGLILFDARPLTNRQFTKRDCFVKLGCDTEEHWNARKVIATIVIVRKCKWASDFLEEWLLHCLDRAAITDDPNVCGLADLEGYLEHRWDQAILSVLASKYNLETYRNPVVWGNFLKLPEFRVPGEMISGPFYMCPEIVGYAENPQLNSPYGTLFVINRQPNYVGKKYGPPKRASLVSRILGRIARITQ